MPHVFLAHAYPLMGMLGASLRKNLFLTSAALGLRALAGSSTSRADMAPEPTSDIRAPISLGIAVLLVKLGGALAWPGRLTYYAYKPLWCQSVSVRFKVPVFKAIVVGTLLSGLTSLALTHGRILWMGGLS